MYNPWTVRLNAVAHLIGGTLAMILSYWALVQSAHGQDFDTSVLYLIVAGMLGRTFYMDITGLLACKEEIEQEERQYWLNGQPVSLLRVDNTIYTVMTVEGDVMWCRQEHLEWT